MIQDPQHTEHLRIRSLKRDGQQLPHFQSLEDLPVRSEKLGGVVGRERFLVKQFLA
jgi:hypothetical protein